MGDAVSRDTAEAEQHDLAMAAVEALVGFSEELAEDEKRHRLVEATLALSELAKLLRGDRSGSAVVLDELKAAYPAPVPRSVLQALSGIQEWARRLREHRVESGFEIEFDGSGYRLVRIEPDEGTAKRWALLNEVRRRSGASMDRLRSLFIENVGGVFKTAEVVYVGRVSSAPRRVRQLRTEEGLRIESHKDNPELGLGEYMLIDSEPIPHAEREGSATVRAEILERDGFACSQCGRGPDRVNRIWLEVDHIVPINRGGSNDPANLRALCNLCHRARGRES